MLMILNLKLHFETLKICSPAMSGHSLCSLNEMLKNVVAMVTVLL